MSLMVVIILSLIGCNNSTSVAQTANSSIEEVVEEVDYSMLIKLQSVETGWDVVTNASFGKATIRLSVKNISGKSIKERVYIKYRLTENEEVIKEGSKTLQYRKSIPWNAGLVKSITVDGGYFHDVMRHNIHAEIFDENNNLLWEGNIEKRILKRQ
jgi:hypothetical protein